MKYVENSTVDNKENYLSIVQAQMMNDELFLLFFDALSKFGYPKLYRIVAKYGLLENLQYHELDYFKILQRRFYPDTYFKHSPNNAVLVVGYFDKLRESTIMKLSEMFNATLIDFKSTNYTLGSRINLRIDGDENLIVKNLSDVLHSDTLYLFDCSFMVYAEKIIDSSVFKKLNPMAVILCEDDATLIHARYKDYGHHYYDMTIIRSIIESEGKAVAKFCEDYNIPCLTCKSEDIQSMSEFISGFNYT